MIQNVSNTKIPRTFDLSTTSMVFSYIENHLALSRLLLNSNADPQFPEKRFSLPKITDLLQTSLKNCSDTGRQEAIISFAIYGSYRLLLEWINQDDRIPSDQQATLTLDLARRVCGQNPYCGVN